MSCLKLVLSFFILLSVSFLTLFPPFPAFATHTSCHPATATSSATVINGLISTVITENVTSNTGECVIDAKAFLVPEKLDRYEDLKSRYYTQAKTTATVNKTTLAGSRTQIDIPLSTLNQLYHISGDLTISANPTGTMTGVIFVEGNLNITGNYTYGSASSGTVFIVKGNINIEQSVTQVDAVLFSASTICTASSSGICPAGLTDPATTSQLIINGSLTSLDPAKPIRFRRSLSSNDTVAAEKINAQLKYLILLRNLLSKTLLKWSEATSDIAFSTPPPATVPGAPTIGTATAGNASAAVPWTNPLDGGSPIIDYTVTSTPGSITATSTASPATVIGLTNDTAYTFTVRARNAVGSGPESAASNSVTPTADCDPANPNIYQLISSLVKDADNEGYSVGIAATQCVGDSTITSGRTYYKDASGAFTWLPSSSSLGADCYDLNANARPGQTAYFNTNRGDGSFDYDCSGADNREYAWYTREPANFYSNTSCTTFVGSFPSGFVGWTCGASEAVMNATNTPYDTTYHRGDGFSCFLNNIRLLDTVPVTAVRCR